MDGMPPDCRQSINQSTYIDFRAEPQWYQFDFIGNLIIYMECTSGGVFTIIERKNIVTLL